MQRRPLIAILFSFILSASAFAQEVDTTYRFGGACGSQGAWTAEALAATNNIKVITQKLASNAECKGIAGKMQSAIAALQEQINSANNEPAGAASLNEIPGEISALRSFINLGPRQKSKVYKLLLSKVNQVVTQQAKIGETLASADKFTPMAEAILKLKQRISRSSKEGLALFNDFVDEIPAASTCIKNPQVAGQLLAFSAKVLGAFASSQQNDISGSLATSISKLSNAMREMNFSTVMRNINLTEYYTSVSCVMEVVSESYCTARDANYLLEEGVDVLNAKAYKADSKTKGIDEKEKKVNPFAGFAILNYHVPNITEWIQKIQIGVDPTLDTDAIFKNRVLDEVNNFFKMVNSLRGNYRQNLSSLASFQDLPAKKRQVLKILMDATNGMGANTSGIVNAAMLSDNNRNFFLIRSQGIYIPFLLSGIDAPEAVTSPDKLRMSPEEWFNINLDKLKEFQNPDEMADRIGKNLNELIRQASINAIEYYNRWFIVDQINLGAEFDVSMRFTVYQSMMAINRYLEDLKFKVAESKTQNSLLPLIIDTQNRLQIILDSYKENIVSIHKEQQELIRTIKYANTTSKGGDLKVPLTEDQALVLESHYKKFVKTVFEQFMVLLTRSGFLLNRLSTIVLADYSLALKNDQDFSRYQKEIFLATGKMALDRMLSLFGNNVSLAKQDLSSAMGINKSNLNNLEILFKDNLISRIAFLRMIATNQKPNGFHIGLNSMFRLMQDASVLPINADDPVWVRVAKTFIGFNPLQKGWNDWAHLERYPVVAPIWGTLWNGVNYMPDDEFGSAKALYSQYCTQALAFNDLNALWPVCSDVVLTSPFDREKPKAELKASYLSNVFRLQAWKYLKNDYLVDKTDKRLKNLNEHQQESYNYSDRICAFRDYNRRNLIHYVTLGLEEQEQIMRDMQQ